MKTVITKNKKINCEFCNREFKTPQYLHCHLRIHKISKEEILNKYYLKNFKLLNKRDKLCNFCKKEKAESILNVDYKNKTIEFTYNGFICNKEDCLNKRIKDFCNGDKSKYEFIGSKKEFLAIKYGISIEQAIKLKNFSFESIKKLNKNLSDNQIKKKLKEKITAKNLKPYKSNLSDFIARHGEKEGTLKYNERCKKIGFGNTLQFYINKYGEKDGFSKYQIKIEKQRKTFLTGKTISKSSEILKNFLISNNYVFEQEFSIVIENKNYFVDFYIPKHNCILEFFGDFWHCNPKFYNENYYNKILKLTSKEKIEKDKNRIKLIRKFNPKNKIIIFWESSQLNEIQLNKLIKSKQGNKVTYI